MKSWDKNYRYIYI